MQCTVIINKLKNNYSNRLLDRSTILNRLKKIKQYQYLITLTLENLTLHDVMFSLKSTKSSTKETNTSPARTKDRDKIVGLSV